MICEGGLMNDNYKKMTLIKCALCLMIIFVPHLVFSGGISDLRELLGKEYVFVRPLIGNKYSFYQKTKHGFTNWPNVKELLGKKGTVVNVEKGRYSIEEIVTIKIQELNMNVYTTSAGEHVTTVLPNVVPFADLKKAKTLIGKTVWNKRQQFVYDEKQKDFLKFKNLEKLKIIDVKVDGTIDKPFKFSIENTKRQIGYWFGSISSDNKYHLFDNAWHFSNPYKQHPHWSKEIWELIENEKVEIGMTKDMVLISWGKPKDINRALESEGIHELWVYDSKNLYMGY